MSRRRNRSSTSGSTSSAEPSLAVAAVTAAVMLAGSRPSRASTASCTVRPPHLAGTVSQCADPRAAASLDDRRLGERADRRRPPVRSANRQAASTLVPSSRTRTTCLRPRRRSRPRAAARAASPSRPRRPGTSVSISSTSAPRPSASSSRGQVLVDHPLDAVQAAAAVDRDGDPAAADAHDQDAGLDEQADGR